MSLIVPERMVMLWPRDTAGCTADWTVLADHTIAGVRRFYNEQSMATRQERLGEFNESVPPIGKPVQLLCEDHCGTYVAPFVCERRNGSWYRIGATVPVEANVIGWRRTSAKPKARVGTGPGFSRRHSAKPTQ